MATFIAQVSCIGVGLLAGWLAPRAAGQAWLSRDTWINVGTGALLYPVRLGLVLLGVDTLHGVVPLSSVGPGLAQLVLAVVLLDFCKYWLHFADHRVPFLWRFHRVHHSVERMDATAGLRMHLVDFLQLSALPILLFGVLFDTRGSPPWVVPGVLIVGIVADTIEHANVPFKVDTWWKRVWFYTFNTPLFHSWHHTREGHLIDGNYAAAFPIWDRLFGTDVTRPEPPALYGLGEDRLDASVLGMQALRSERTG